MPADFPKNQDDDLAENRAMQVATGWDRLEVGRTRIERQRNSALAEAEASALAQIRADTERQLSNQATALRDSERRAELAAIDRRNKELEAAREAERRRLLDVEAMRAAEARRVADAQCAAAATQRREAAESANIARQQLLSTERTALAARRHSWRARLTLVWAVFSSLHPLTVMCVALILGAVSGYGWGWWQGSSPGQNKADEAGLRLETELRVPPRNR